MPQVFPLPSGPAAGWGWECCCVLVGSAMVALCEASLYHRLLFPSGKLIGLTMTTVYQARYPKVFMSCSEWAVHLPIRSPLLFEVMLSFYRSIKDHGENCPLVSQITAALMCLTPRCSPCSLSLSMRITWAFSQHGLRKTVGFLTFLGSRKEEAKANNFLKTRDWKSQDATIRNSWQSF